MKAMLAVVHRDLLLAMRRKTEVLTALFFFVIVTSLFPLGIGPEPALLRKIAPGVLWVGALLATMLGLQRMFAADPPMLGEPVDHLLGFDPLAESIEHPRHFVLHSRRHTAYCVPMTAGSRMLGRVLTLIESPAELQ